MIASITQLPFFVCTCVLGGFALWGLFGGGPSSYAQTAMLFGAFQSAGGLIADVLIIVGLALILRRLPARAK